MPKDTSSDVVTFATVQTKDNEQIRALRIVYNGRGSLRLQAFYRKEATQDYQYGKALVFKYENIDEIVQGLLDMKTWCENNPNGDE
jgi:hypothetical protein